MTVRFRHESAKDDDKERRGVVVARVWWELDVVPGFTERPEHDDVFEVVDPPKASGFDHTTYLDMRDVNHPRVSTVDVLGIFPFTLYRALRRRLAELGVVPPEADED
jgi:hypothetical protein